MASRLCLHIGLHKTATTAIQDFLESQQVQLEGRGVRYISRAQWRSENRPGPAKRLANQVKTGASETLLLSEENLIGTPREFAEGGVYPESRKRLYALLSQVGNIPVDIIIVFRDPCRFLVSIYCEYVRNNHFMPFAEFIARHDVERFSWRRVFSWLYETPSNVRVHGLPFEQEHGGGVIPVTRTILELACGDANTISLSSFPKRKSRASYLAEELALAETIAAATDPETSSAFLRMIDHQGRRFGETSYMPFPGTVRQKLNGRYLEELPFLTGKQGEAGF